jgi:hypothetical protein
MCEHAQMRYVHVMMHPDYAGELEVGCVCVGYMEQDLVAAQRREAEFKRQQDPRVANLLAWVATTDELLASGKLDPSEREFISWLRGRAAYYARPRSRKDLELSHVQKIWFKKIYLRVVGSAS